MGRRVAAVLLALAVGYGAIKAWPLISGPSIRIDELSTSEAGITTLSGRAIHTETLMVNGGVQLIDRSGAFSVRLTLPRGGGILTLTATDRFGRSRAIERAVVIP
jgi:hypothetical protein